MFLCREIRPYKGGSRILQVGRILSRYNYLNVRKRLTLDFVLASNFQPNPGKLTLDRQQTTVYTQITRIVATYINGAIAERDLGHIFQVSIHFLGLSMAPRT